VISGKLLDVCLVALLRFVEAAFKDPSLQPKRRTEILCGVVLTRTCQCSATVGVDDEVTTAYMFLDTGKCCELLVCCDI
jgi:hypothetical protein